MAKRNETGTVTLIEIETMPRQIITIHLIGETPLILNRLSEKAKRELLYPRGRLTTAAKKTNMKHDPLSEYRASPYLDRNAGAPTAILMPSTAFKKALRDAAADIEGLHKTQVGRLTYILRDYVPVYGVPKLLMSIVRSADMNHTPDVRTRAIVERWAVKFELSFVSKFFSERSIVNLCANAGMTMGVGDYRVEKGAGAYGQFRVCDRDDKDFIQIVKSGGRAAQLRALENPEFYDPETEELYSWFNTEISRRATETQQEKISGNGRKALAIASRAKE